MATIQPIYAKDNGFKYLDLSGKWNRPRFDKRTFSEGNIGEVAQNGKPDQNGNPLNNYTDGWDEYAGGSFYDLDPAGGVNKVCRTRVPKDSKGAVSVGGTIGTGKRFYKGDVVYVGCKLFFPIGFDMNAVKDVSIGGRQKFLRVYAKDTTGQFISGFNDMYIIRDPDTAGKNCQFQFIKEGEDGGASWRNIGDRSHDIVQGQWESYQMAVFVDDIPESEGGTGKIEFYKNGEFVDAATNVKTINHPDDEVGEFYCFTYWDDKEASSEQTWFIDEPFISNLDPDGFDSQGNARFEQ